MCIAGTVHRLDDGCEAPAGNLAGSWCFSSTSPMAYHQMIANNTATPADETLLSRTTGLRDGP